MQSLRILHIISGDRWAGAEVQAYTLLKELAKEHDVHVILLNSGELANRLKALGIDTQIIDENTHSSFKIFLALRQHIKRLEPQIIHTHRQKENILTSIANWLTIRARCIRTVHGAPEFTPSGLSKVQNIVDDLCGKYLQDAIIAVSDDLKIKLASKFRPEKIHVVANGIDADDVRQGLVIPDFKAAMPEAVHVGIVGRLDPVKRIDIFLATAATLLKNHPESLWQFHVFGEGELEHEMKALAVSLGIDQNVIFHGHRMDIRSCINALDAVVMCSDHEGLPITALECLALSTPIFAHNIGGLTALLSNYPILRVEISNSSEFAQRISDYFLHHSHIKIELGKKYSSRQNMQDVAALYRESTS